MTIIKAIVSFRVIHGCGKTDPISQKFASWSPALRWNESPRAAAGKPKQTRPDQTKSIPIHTSSQTN